MAADWILAYARAWTAAFDRAGPDPITASGEAIDWHGMVTCFAAAEALRESVTQGRFRSGRRDRPQHPSVRVV